MMRKRREYSGLSRAWGKGGERESTRWEGVLLKGGGKKQQGTKSNKKRRTESLRKPQWLKRDPPPLNLPGESGFIGAGTTRKGTDIITLKTGLGHQRRKRENSCIYFGKGKREKEPPRDIRTIKRKVLGDYSGAGTPDVKGEAGQYFTLLSKATGKKVYGHLKGGKKGPTSRNSGQGKGGGDVGVAKVGSSRTNETDKKEEKERIQRRKEKRLSGIREA